MDKSLTYYIDMIKKHYDKETNTLTVPSDDLFFSIALTKLKMAMESGDISEKELLYVMG